MVTSAALLTTRLVDPELYATGDPFQTWRWMREHSPVHWHPPGEFPGFWSLTRYEDVRAVYRDPETFSSAHGVLLRPTRLGDDPGAGMTLALTDPPRHRALRSIVAEWFSERAVRSLRDEMRPVARAAVARGIERGECDFASDVASRLSLEVICQIIGVPPADRDAVYRWTNEMFHSGRPLAVHQQLMQYLIDLMERRFDEPCDDLMSALVTATVNGEFLTEEEILLNCENLLGATENAQLGLAGSVLAFLEHPDQWRRLREDRSLLPTAVEEVLRWTSSATHSMRRATRPVVVRGQLVDAGDWVVLWPPSANRDETAFHHPDRFDIGRRPNRHLAFGFGEHYCVGATLARAELTVLLTELLDSVGQIEQIGPAVLARSIAVRGPEKLPVRMTAA